MSIKTVCARGHVTDKKVAVSMRDRVNPANGCSVCEPPPPGERAADELTSIDAIAAFDDALKQIA